MPGRLRVVFDARSVVAHRSGVGNYTASLLRHMVRLDDQVEWLVLRHPSATEPIAPGSTVTERPFAGETKSVHTVLRLGRAGGFGDRHLYHSPADLIPHRLRCPAVVTIHDLMWVESPELGSAFAPVRLANGWWYRHNIGSAIRRSSAVIAISEATAEAIRRNYPQHARKVRVIHHGLDRRRFHPDRALPRAALDPWIPAGCPYSLIVGQGSPYKNHDGMVRAFLRAMADRPQHRLVMVRRFERIDGAVRRLLAQPEVRSRVHPLPHVSDELLCTLYRHARMLLSASHCEGFGMPVLEAMSMGTVVLTSTAPALLEVTGEAAVHVDATDEEALASAIRRLDDDSALRQRLARAGRHQARRFSWQRAAELTLASYREAVGLGAEGGNRTPDTARMKRLL